MNATTRRISELNKKNKVKKAWKINLKYSIIIFKNKGTLNFNEFKNYYKQYITELKSNNLETKKKNYINNWIELNNCFKKKKNKSKIKECINKLYYTSFLNNIN